MTLLIDLSNPAHAAVVLFALIVLMVFSYCGGWRGHKEKNNGDGDPIEGAWIIALVVCFCGLLSCIVNLIWKAL
jgi:hypothetical protein